MGVSIELNIYKINFWYVSSFFVSLLVALPIVTVFFGFFETTSDYFSLLKNTFLLKYISNSILLLIGVLLLSFLFGVGSAYCVSFFDFPGVNFFKWALILSFAVAAYIYASCANTVYVLKRLDTRLERKCTVCANIIKYIKIIRLIIKNPFSIPKSTPNRRFSHPRKTSSINFCNILATIVITITDRTNIAKYAIVT